MNGDAKPTEDQKRWLATIFGGEVWRELIGKAEFAKALDTSIQNCRRIALQHIAQKERAADSFYRK